MTGHRTPGPELERSGCGAAVVLWCLAWIVVGLPVAACVIGWVFR